MGLLTVRNLLSLLPPGDLRTHRGRLLALAVLAAATVTAWAAAGGLATAAKASSPDTGSISVRVDSGDDDAHHNPQGWPHYSDSDIRILAGAPGEAGPTYGGWRWDGLDIPDGAIITSAYVELTQKWWGYTFETELSLEDDAAPQPFSPGSSPFDRWHDRTGFTVPWTWDKGTPDSTVRTPDLTAGVQELVNRYGGLDAIALLESGEGVSQRKYHEWHAFENDPSKAAKLVVEWRMPDVEPTPTQEPDPQDGMVWERIDSGNDDAHHNPLGWPHYSDTDIRVLAGAPGSNGPTYGGWRWDDLGIPQNATITSAYVELTQKEWGYVFQTELSFQDGAAPQSFTPGSSPFDRWQGRTGFSMPWTWQKSIPGSTVRTPDLAAGVQELVDRYGGLDAIVLLESGEGVDSQEYHSWHSFDGDPAKAATLHITWTVDDEPEPTTTPVPPTATPEPTATPGPSHVNWDGIGEVLLVGPSQDPNAVTSAASQFSFNEDGSIDQVVITTTNEFVAGLLLGPGGTSALTDCSDEDGGTSCALLADLLTGASVSSLHTSVATLDVAFEATIQLPAGEGFIEIPIVGGGLTGQLNGVFILSKGSDFAPGAATLEIQPGSFGTYACFGLTPAGIGPLDSLDPCISGTGGQFFPIELDVIDVGTFNVGQGSGVLSAIMGVSGNVEVNAVSNLLQLSFGGTITITYGVATLDPSGT